MTTTTATGSTLRIRLTPSAARTHGGLRVLDVREDLSRITRANGEIVGYVDRVVLPGGPAYRARRYVAAERRFVELPAVWSADDAVDTLRW